MSVFLFSIYDKNRIIIKGGKQVEYRKLTNPHNTQAYTSTV